MDVIEVFEELNALLVFRARHAQASTFITLGQSSSPGLLPRAWALTNSSLGLRMLSKCLRIQRLLLLSGSFSIFISFSSFRNSVFQTKKSHHLLISWRLFWSNSDRWIFEVLIYRLFRSFVPIVSFCFVSFATTGIFKNQRFHSFQGPFLIVSIK